MPKCSKCGISGNINDETKFIRHGYPKDGCIRISCKTCGSGTMQNTLFENIFVYLEYILIFGFVGFVVLIFFASLLFLAVNGLSGS